MLQKIAVNNYQTFSGRILDNVQLSYEIFGQELHTAPIVMVNHALTGNSSVIGEKGWWNGLIGSKKCIDLNHYTVLVFNIPGNGYDGVEENLLVDHTLLNAGDVARIFAAGLEALGIKELYAAIGGSIGGGIAWELAAFCPQMIRHLIPIATDWKSTDWLKANCLVQQQILNNSRNPVHDARLHAMLMYRTPQSFRQKFDRTYNEDKDMFNVESWLLHHGDKLNQRFLLSAYKALNYMLANIDITRNGKSFTEVASAILSEIHIVSVNSDIFFTEDEDQRTFEALKKIKKNVTYGIIDSIHGHDAFLIEFEQLTGLLKNVF